MEKTIKVLSVNISEKKGTIKSPIDTISLTKTGVEKDAHSGPWNRMVSLLGMESIDKFAIDAGRKIAFGEFAENITTQGIKLYKTLPLDRFVNDDLELEVTQIGKECHGTNCEIFREVGNCVMPKEGIFARVIRQGKMKAGDELQYKARVIKSTVITLSDRAFNGVYADKSGKQIEKRLNESWDKTGRPSIVDYVLIPDDAELLKKAIREAIDSESDFIFTTGGTGISPRDITPDVIKPMLDKELPGIMDLIRMKYGAEKPAALLSRSIAGVIGQTLVYCLPGSSKAVNEYLDEILKTTTHSLYMIHQLDIH